MPKPLFISYSTGDTATTEQIRDHLEAQGIPCWMAPRDINPGEDYAEQIINAIEGCTVLLLVLSETSNHSQYVIKEVERAIAKRKVVIPLRIHNVTPSRSLEFFISNAQWIDAMQPPLTAPLSTLVGALHNHLQGRAEDEPAPSQPQPNIPATPAPPAFLTEDAQPPAQESHFVAREAELRQLDGFLAQALRGQGQVIFVAGEAGAGKSALLHAFARQAQAQHADLIVAGGSCDAYAGIGDPYLPFRTLLSLLVGDVEAGWRAGAIRTDHARRLWHFAAHTLAAIAHQGPDWVDTLVAGATLLRQVRALASPGGEWRLRLEQLVSQRAAGQGVAMATQSNLFYQSSQVLNTLAQAQPLLLLLDDLHWADSASLQLLFHLARQLKTSRVLIVGSYRPEDVALGRDGERHPLEPLINELKRYDGNILVDLNAARAERGQRFVEALLDAEPHHLSATFRQALYARTEGHPLFTIEVLRNLQERGELVKDAADRWVESPTLDWATLPARVEGVIAERIARLSDDLQQTLTIASVMGLEFTAQVVARVQPLAERTLLTTLARELDKRHRLVQEAGEQKLGRQMLTHYRFAHALFQRYLYQALSAGERRLLHGDVATTLADLYAGHTDTIAAELARHYDAAGDDEHAVVYLQQAAQQATARYANEAAVEYLSRALALTPADNVTLQVDLLLAREEIFELQGERDAQKTDLARLESLVTTLDDKAQQAAVLIRQAVYANVTDAYPAGIAAAQRALTLAQEIDNRGLEAMAHLYWGQCFLRQGLYREALPHFVQATEQARMAGKRLIEAASLGSLGSVYYQQSDYNQARYYYEQKLALCQAIGDRRGEASVLCYLGATAYAQGDLVSGQVYFERSLYIAREIGNRADESYALLYLGSSANNQSDYSSAIHYIEQALCIDQELNDRRSQGYELSFLAQVYLTLGAYATAQTYAEQSLQTWRAIGQQNGERLALTVLSGITYEQGKTQQACDYAQQAIKITRSLAAWPGLADALTYYGHACMAQGRLSEANAVYTEAQQIWQRIEQRNFALEALAGLAQVALAEQNQALALEHVETILDHLAHHTMNGVDEPLLIYWTCYQTLQAHADPRMQTILQSAYELIQTRAAKIQDETLRYSYVENVAVHRAIVQEWQSQQAG